MIGPIARLRRQLRAPDWLRWLGRHELATLAVMAVAAGGIWLFALLAGEVMEGDTRAFDEAVLLAMRDPADRSDPLGPKWVEEMGRDFTALGGVGFLTLLTLAVVGYLVLERKVGAALFIVAAVVGGRLLSAALKYGFDRPRPDLVPHGSFVYTASFPSGHSMLAAITYLTLGVLLARVQPRRALKAYILILAIVVTVLVGISRVYLGVHWPTDVLAGWTAGAVWAMACWLAVRWLQRRGEVEKDTDNPPGPDE
ncbi:MAG: phosphatase PAP2 family protein [Pseudomonadota bacterium]|nr:phosphatase PAP2 family protein [Pseudomonadota bacterium]